MFKWLKGLWSSPKDSVLLIEGRNNSSHTVKCDWMYLDWGDVSVRVKKARLELWTDGQDRIANVNLVLDVERTSDNKRRGCDKIVKNMPGVLRIKPDWPWGRPEYDVMLYVAEAHRSWGKVVLGGRVMQIVPHNQAAVLLPAFDRTQRQMVTLQDVLRVAGQNQPKKKVADKKE